MSRSRQPPLEYVGGDPSLDLVNTVDWLDGHEGEDGDGQRLGNERLTSYERLVRWAEGAEILTTKEARELRRQAAKRPEDAAAALEKAHDLRWLLRQLFLEVTEDALSEATCRELDEWLAKSLVRLGVTPSAETPAARWRWHDAGEHLDSLLWPVAWSAAKLVTSDETPRIRVCAGPDCGWIYVDRSRNGLRRWCQMKTCGTAAKTRRRRVRKRA